MTETASCPAETASPGPAARAAFYLSIWTGRQAQRQQAETYATSRGWEVVAEYVEPGQSAIDDRRPEFQRLLEAALHGGTPFEVVLVHPFSRFFRDQFQLEFYLRKLAKAGVRLVSITQELGDNPMSNTIRQIMALFDDPIHAETVRLVYRLALQRAGNNGPMGLKAITKHLNGANIRTRDGGRLGIAAVHQVLTRTTCWGEHRFNTRNHRTKRPKPEAEHAVMAVLELELTRFGGRVAV